MDAPADLIAGRLLREMSSWKSMEIKIRDERTQSTTFPGFTGPQITHLDYHMIETADGKRFLSYKTFLEKKLSNENLGYCDGVKCANVQYEASKPGGTLKARQAFINREFGNEARFNWTDRPLPLRAFYVGLSPLHQKIADAEQIGTERVAGRECVVYLVRGHVVGSKTQDLAYSLDRETSVPLKLVAYTAPDLYPSGKPEWGWEADSFDEVRGFHVPKKSHYSGYSHSPGAKPLVTLADTITVEEISYDRNYEKSTFWPAIPAGVPVIDSTQNPVRPKPAPRAEVPGTRPTVAESATVEPPSRMPASLPVLGMGLGAMLLIAGFVTMRRKR